MKRSAVVCLFVGVGLFVAAAGSLTIAQPETKIVRKVEVKTTVQPTKDAKPADAKPATPAQPGDAKKPPIDDKLEAARASAMAKNEHHERFKMFEGTWDCAMKFWEPGQPEFAGTGTMTNTLIHGGRYVQHEFKSEFMGDSFTGSGTWGFNNVTRKYEGTWCDNMTTGIMFSTGTYDEATKTYTSNCEFEQPGGGKVKQREVTTVVDKDKHVTTMYHQIGTEKENKIMELTYTRAKPAEKSATDAAADKANKEIDKIKSKIPGGK